MKNKRQIAFNKVFTLFIILGILILLVSISCFSEGDIGFGIGMCIVAGLFLIGAPILLPCYYLYDKEGVTLVYVYMPNERYLWKNIYEIRVIDDDTHSNRKALFFFLVYKITGDVEGKKRFYMDGHIQKSFRNKRLIQKYYDDKIIGYFDDEIEDFKAWRAKRKNKKQKQNQMNFAAEIPRIERKLRTDLHNSLQCDINAAQKLGLTLRIEYRYVTKQGTLNSRPKTDYTYTALVNIAHPNEREKTKKLCMEVKLLSVQLKETDYHFVIHDKERNAFLESLFNTFLAIEQTSFEDYMQKRP